MNSSSAQLIQLFPYSPRPGYWCFDDESVGLHAEAFVLGIETMIERLVEDIPNAREGFALTVGVIPFPGWTIALRRDREEGGGNWYYCEQFRIEGWLCPALFKYFPDAPAKLYAMASPCCHRSIPKP